MFVDISLAPSVPSNTSCPGARSPETVYRATGLFVFVLGYAEPRPTPFWAYDADYVDLQFEDIMAS